MDQLTEVVKDLQIDQQKKYGSLRELLGADLDTSMIRTP